mgnify:CR=1 FL=1|jgi:hypothetical protein
MEKTIWVWLKRTIFIHSVVYTEAVYRVRLYCMPSSFKKRAWLPYVCCVHIRTSRTPDWSREDVSRVRERAAAVSSCSAAPLFVTATRTTSTGAIPSEGFGRTARHPSASSTSSGFGPQPWRKYCGSGQPQPRSSTPVLGHPWLSIGSL